jgi:hypothetical protein
MKTRSINFKMALAAIMATGVFLDDPGSKALAQNAPATPAVNSVQAPALPYGASEVVKMYQGGVNKDIIVNYIDSNTLPYHLGADAIIYLQSIGLPQEITQTMITRDSQLQQQQQMANQQYYQQQAMTQNTTSPYGAVPPQAPQQVVTPTTPAPQVTVIGSDYPAYDYAYPYYGYPYYYGGVYAWPGWGWGGRGWGYGGFRGGFGGFRGGFGEFHGGESFHGGFGGGGGFHGGFGGGGHGGGHR